MTAMTKKVNDEKEKHQSRWQNKMLSRKRSTENDNTMEREMRERRNCVDETQHEVTQKCRSNVTMTNW